MILSLPRQCRETFTEDIDTRLNIHVWIVCLIHVKIYVMQKDVFCQLKTNEIDCVENRKEELDQLTGKVYFCRWHKGDNPTSNERWFLLHLDNENNVEKYPYNDKDWN